MKIATMQCILRFSGKNYGLAKYLLTKYFEKYKTSPLSLPRLQRLFRLTKYCSVFRSHN